MIQTILLFTLRPGVTDEQVEALRAGLAAIPFEGRRNMRLGRDIGLLDGAMDLAIVTDYDDAMLRAAAERAGAREYVVKDNLIDVRRVLAGVPRSMLHQTRPALRHFRLEFFRLRNGWSLNPLAR